MYIHVLGTLDHLLKVIRFAARGYAINVHVNAEAAKGYILALIAIVVGRLFLRKANMTFHGGLPQSYFPAPKGSWWYWKFKFLFGIASGVLCDSDDIKREIVKYGVAPDRIGTAAGYSAQNLEYQQAGPSAETEAFLHNWIKKWGF